MRLVSDGEYYRLISRYDEREIAKRAGFRWNPLRKQWETKIPEVAARLRDYADQDLKARLEELVARKKEALEASRATSADIEVAAPTGLSYLPYQLAAIKYALQKPATLIADEMGLGKTIEAIGVVNADESIRKVLVICPASLKINWRRELERWLTRPLSVGIANGDEFPGTDIVVINYDILSRHSDALRATTWDLLIADECSYLKNPKAIRTQQVFGGGDVAPIPARKKLFLSGTPILNRPIELWPLLRALDPNGLGRSWFRYVTRYCAAYRDEYGWRVDGASNLEELQRRLRESIMIRRLKKDVLAELPAKRRQIIELPANGAATLLRHEAETAERWEDALAEMRARVELAKASDSEEEYQAAVAALRNAARVAFEEMSRIRHEVALTKVPYVVEYIQDCLQNEEKIILYAHHQDVIESLMRQLAAFNPVKLVGGMPTAERQHAVDRFQNDPSCRVFIGSIRAAGLGITLTAASHVVFAELDWTPAMMTQAEDRAHRIGQKEMVLITHLVLEGSLDARLAKTLVEKQEVIDRAMDAPIEQDEQLAAVETLTQSDSVSRKSITEEAEQITPAEIEEIHRQIRYLAALDRDRATVRNGIGFNKVDSIIGHRLAMLPSLSPRQAVLCKKLLHKYRGQLEGVAVYES